MNILMMTNTYLPHTGGVARSVDWFAEALRALGHKVLIVAPTYSEMPHGEHDVIRVPAIQHFNGSDFSVRLPIPGLMTARLESFHPDIVHAHHPFLLGDTALRVATLRGLPIVFTHHTMYEHYTHYVPGDSTALQRFAIRLATEFANRCDHIVAPSESIAGLLRKRGVTRPLSAIPTGIRPDDFHDGCGRTARRRYGIPPEALLLGHVGRLAEEKNLPFLARNVGEFLRQHDQAHLLLVGQGDAESALEEIWNDMRVADRVHHPPQALHGQELADAYHALDLFVFASLSETQGMVLAEAMTCGVPVIAIDAPGAREIVVDGVNGRLLASEDSAAFQAALEQFAGFSLQQRREWHEAALRTAQEFSMQRSVEKLQSVYHEVVERGHHDREEDNTWAALLRRIEEEWNIWSGLTYAVGDALFGTGNGAAEDDRQASPDGQETEDFRVPSE